ncbi:hypothetical protein B0H63DRAFT_319385 [Podospora didyma]|uniref:Ankyrin n=1 Tax=Podospora didyma TaxID=330526 RepID=A0AAE0K6T4_9PEZI|nr:hypothetical protein B0H63DRAFT_319385 [Podospora didyma]
MLAPIFLAVANGHTDIMALLYRAGSSENSCLTSGRKLLPLHVAAGVPGDDASRVRFILEHQDTALSQLHKQNYAGLTPIRIANPNENWSAVSYLQSWGANINDEAGTPGSGSITFARALLQYNVDEAKLLMEVGATLDWVLRQLPTYHGLTFCQHRATEIANGRSPLETYLFLSGKSDYHGGFYGALEW